MSAATGHGHGHGHAEPAEDAAPLGGALSRLRPLLFLLRPHRRLLAAAVASGIAHHGTVIASGVIAAAMVGGAVTGASADTLRPLLVALLILVVPLVVTPWLETQIAHTMAFRVLVDVRGRVYAAFQRLAPAGLLRRRAGDVGSTAMSDVELLEVFFAHTLTQLVSAAVVPLGATIAVAFYHPLLAAALVPVLVAAAVVPARLRRHSLRSGAELRDRLGDLGADVVDGVQGLREILAAGAGERRLALLDQHGRRLLRVRSHHARRSGIEAAASDAVVTAGILVVLVTAGLLVSAGHLAAADLPAAVVLCALAFAPVVAVVDVARELAAVAAAADRVRTLLDEPTLVPDVPGPAGDPLEPVLEFRDVRFRYAPELPEVLHGVSFRVRPGETVALVGHSGAGKSTCAHLALRLWDAGSGEVLIGGRDVRALPTAQLRRTVAHVPQDVHLFNQTIAENLRLGAPDASDDAVEAAARQALAAGFVHALPQGYDTVAGELGATLSGGQRQRLAIARALLVDAPVMVLDEAVSNLDTESERELRAAMSHARDGRTILVIAHRLSTIAAADRVVMLDHGRVVATGAHTELLRESPAYRELLASQDVTVQEEDPV